MTHEEVHKEILKDLPNVQRWEEHQWKEFRRRSLKMKEFPKFIFTEYKSPRKNMWLVSTRFNKKDDFGSAFGVLQIQNGLVLHQVFVNVCDDNYNTVCTFIPHFFERYAKHNNLKIKGKELIKHVLMNDCAFYIDRTNEISGAKDRYRENNVHLCMKHGVGLGYEVGCRHHLIKTYITYEMSHGRQKKIFDANRQEVISASIRYKASAVPIVKTPVITEKEVEKVRQKLDTQ